MESLSPPDSKLQLHSLGTGAASFKRVLGSANNSKLVFHLFSSLANEETGEDKTR